MPPSAEQFDVSVESLTGQLNRCLLIDQVKLRGRLNRLRKHRGDARARGAELGRIVQRIERSIASRQARDEASFTLRYPVDLPVCQQREVIAAAVRDHQVVVVCGETGSGKTTQLPKMCLELGRGVVGRIGHTQPRRIAARTVARRIAEETDTQLGDVIGYKVRFADRTSDGCRVKILTDGMLLAETQHDRALNEYDTIIVDEAHERSLNIDFLLGYLKHLLPRRPDLKIIIMSATIDPQRFSEHFDGAPIVEVSGRTYPVEMRYRPLVRYAEQDNGDQTRTAIDLEQGIASAVTELCAESPANGDILVFLPGEREIHRTAKHLRGLQLDRTEILPLYARLSTAAQDKVFAAHQGRRIVLSTNVAETSLTVPGVRYVIDAGTARISRYSARRRVQMLPVESIARASADQRAGRCGRLGAGVCIRLYEEDDFEKRSEFTDPEIQRTNLASVILQMTALGLGPIERFGFMNPPRKGMITEGRRTLRELGAIDKNGELTTIGKRLAKLPVDPRIGRMILQAEREHCVREVLIIAAGLSVPDPRERTEATAQAADAAHERFHHASSDFVTLLNIWRFYHEQKEKLSWSKLRRCCEQNHLSFVRMREWVDVHMQLRQLATQLELPLSRQDAADDAIHRALMAGLLSNIARRDDRSAYEGADGTQLYLFPGSVIFQAKPLWIVAAEQVETTRLYARMSAAIDPLWLERLADHLLTRSYDNPRFSARSGRVIADERVTLFGLEIISGRTAQFGPVDPQRARELFIQAALVEQRWRTSAPFARHNRRLRDRIEREQAKRRKRDMIVDDDTIYAFFDGRLPADVYDVKHFERWRKVAERGNKNLLFMAESDVLRADAERVVSGDFPDVLLVDGTPLSLDYQMDPGGDCDGVSLTVPIEMLSALDQQRLDWLVPGMVVELITELIRSLPKSSRTRFVPAPNWAWACVERLTFGEGDLAAVAAQTLSNLAGFLLEPDAFRFDALPSHLRMNLRIVDGAGKTVTQGRDLNALRRELGEQAREAAVAVAPKQYSKTGLTAWTFDELPKRIEISGGRVPVSVFPTLVDEGKTVGITLASTEAVARASMLFGLRRLYFLQVRDELRFQIDVVPGIDAMRMSYAALGQTAPLDEALSLLACDEAFLGDGYVARTSKAFEKRLNEGFSMISRAVLNAGQVLREVLESVQALDFALSTKAPPQWKQALEQLRAQRATLLADGFVTGTPRRWLEQYPRYFAAMVKRHEKLAHGGFKRDAMINADIAPLEQRVSETLADARDASNASVERLDGFTHHRWLVEELRVSMFAQELGTVEPVSIKRLNKHWSQISPM